MSTEAEFYPPLNYDEFIKMFNLTEWPAKITSEESISLMEEMGDFQSLTFIENWLQKSIDFSLQPLDNLLQKLDDFEQALLPYSSKILKEELYIDGLPLEQLPKPPKEDKNKENREFVLLNSDLVKSRRKTESTGADEEILKLKLKSVDFVKFPGFRSNDFTDLPGALEAPQVLHRIRKAVPVNPGFRKFFTSILLSPASVGFLQDAFWWIFVDIFESDNEDARRQLFNRLSDSYAALFLSVPGPTLDSFFQHFPEAIAMAVYAIFFEGFSESRKLFGAHFKQRIVNTVHEWCSGVHPLPNSFLSWNVSVLESSDLPVAADAQSAEQLLAKRSAAERVTAAMVAMNDPTEVKLDLDSYKKAILSLGDQKNVSPRTNLISPQKIPELDLKSNPMGKGTLLKTVKFHHLGQSPLIMHYQAMHGRLPMRPEDKRAGLMRTEVSQLPDFTEQTYSEFLHQNKANHLARKAEHVRVSEEVDRDIDRLTKQRLDINRQIKKLQSELDKTKSGLELRLFVNERMNEL